MFSRYCGVYAFFVKSKLRYTCKVFVIDKLWQLSKRSSKLRGFSYMQSIVYLYLLLSKQMLTLKKYPASIGRTCPSILLPTLNCYSNIAFKNFVFLFGSSLKKLLITDCASASIIYIVNAGSRYFRSSESLSRGGIEM
jgi:hypothetical protein